MEDMIHRTQWNNVLKIIVIQYMSKHIQGQCSGNQFSASLGLGARVMKAVEAADTYEHDKTNLGNVRTTS